MDNKMIIDFINNVEPDMSYGSSDGMTRAMVESAENMALINDYIVESTYEVYTEAEENKEGVITKIKNKIHTYFILFVNLVKKAIEKVKGFFLSIKRKLTVAMAKALKAIAKTDLKASSNFAAYKAGGNKVDAMFKRVQIGNTTFNTYEIDDKKYTELVNMIRMSNDMTTFMRTENNQSLEEIEDYIKGIRDDFDEKFVKPKPETGSVLLKPVGHKITMGSDELDKEMKSIFKDVDTIMNDFYNYIMKSYTDVISMLSKEEKAAKDKFSNNPKELSIALKRISKFIHTINYTKYKSSQLVASACLKMYRKSLSEARRLLKSNENLKKKMEQHHARRMNELNRAVDELRTKNKEFDKRTNDVKVK